MRQNWKRVTVMHSRPDHSHGTGSPQVARAGPPVSTPVRSAADAEVAASADLKVPAPGDAPLAGHMEPPEGDERAEVRIIAADPDVAQRVALLLRQGFHCDEPRSYPAGADGHGTLLHLTVDTGRAPDQPPADSPWLVSSRSQGSRAHTDEPG
jgi:hypothetical protein